MTWLAADAAATALLVLFQVVLLRAAMREVRRLEEVNDVAWRWIIARVKATGERGPDLPRHLCRPVGAVGFLRGAKGP